MRVLKCECGSCQTCKDRKRMRSVRRAATIPRPKRNRRGKLPLPLSHNAALRFDAKKRPFDPADAIAHIFAVFTECPSEHKRELLARIKMMVGDVDRMWGGFKFS